MWVKHIVLSSVRFYWTPAPPKLHLSPTTIRNEMFPAYQGAPVFNARSETEHETVQGTLDDSEDDEDSLDKLDPEDIEARQRCVLLHSHLTLAHIKRSAYICLLGNTNKWSMIFQFVY